MGIVKTFSFGQEDTLEKLDKICKMKMRSKSNMIEYLISRYYDEMMEKCDGSRTDQTKAK